MAPAMGHCREYGERDSSSPRLSSSRQANPEGEQRSLTPRAGCYELLVPLFFAALLDLRLLASVRWRRRRFAVLRGIESDHVP
jgi:hypothetical protein